MSAYDALLDVIVNACETAYLGKMRIRKIRAALREADLMLEELSVIELAEQVRPPVANGEGKPPSVHVDDGEPE